MARAWNEQAMTEEEKEEVRTLMEARLAEHSEDRRASALLAFARP